MFVSGDSYLLHRLRGAERDFRDFFFFMLTGYITDHLNHAPPPGLPPLLPPPPLGVKSIFSDRDSEPLGARMTWFSPAARSEPPPCIGIFLSADTE